MDGLVVDKILNPIEIKPQILLTYTIDDDLKPIVDGIVYVFEDELHAGPVFSIVMNVALKNWRWPGTVMVLLMAMNVALLMS